MVNRFTKFSDWSRAVRAVARLKRCIREFKRVQPRTNEATSLDERKEAEIAIVKLVQEDAFAEDIQKIKLQKEGTLNKHQEPCSLNIIMSMYTTKEKA